MSEKSSFEQRVVKALAQFGTEVDEKTTATIVESISTEKDLRRIVALIRRKLEDELEAEVVYGLDCLAPPGRSGIWYLAASSLQDSTHFPASPRARDLSKLLSLPMQSIAAKFVLHHAGETEAHVRPNAVGGRVTLELCVLSRTSPEVLPKYQLLPETMTCSSFWIALCRQIIAQKKRSTKPRMYHGPVVIANKRASWAFDGNRDAWMALLQYVIVHPPTKDTVPAITNGKP